MQILTFVLENCENQMQNIAERKLFFYFCEVIYNILPKIDHGQNIFRPFHVLEQCLFTTNETDLDYNHQKKNAQVVSQVNEKLRT